MATPEVERLEQELVELEARLDYALEIDASAEEIEILNDRIELVDSKYNRALKEIYG